MGKLEYNVGWIAHREDSPVTFGRWLHFEDINCDVHSPRITDAQDRYLCAAAQVSLPYYLNALSTIFGSSWVGSLPAGAVEALYNTDRLHSRV